MKCAIIDDEPLARECLANYVERIAFLDLIGEGSDPTELLEIEENASIDILFMDIQMPLMTGIEYLKMTSKRPMVVLTTAYPSYALQGFELDVLDYLVKPITFERFYKSSMKAKQYYELTQPQPSQSHSQEKASYFFIKVNGIYEKIFYAEVNFIEALQNYIIVHTENGKFMTLIPLKTMEQKLPKTDFIRVHKSYIVAINKISRVEKACLYVAQFKIPLSRNHKEEVMKHVVNRTLYQK